jgi:hypothetical protein
MSFMYALQLLLRRLSILGISLVQESSPRLRFPELCYRLSPVRSGGIFKEAVTSEVVGTSF